MILNAKNCNKSPDLCVIVLLLYAWFGNCAKLMVFGGKINEIRIYSPKHKQLVYSTFEDCFDQIVECCDFFYSSFFKCCDLCGM